MNSCSPFLISNFDFGKNVISGTNNGSTSSTQEWDDNAMTAEVNKYSINFTESTINFLFKTALQWK